MKHRAGDWNPIREAYRLPNTRRLVAGSPSNSTISCCARALVGCPTTLIMSSTGPGGTRVLLVVVWLVQAVAAVLLLPVKALAWVLVVLLLPLLLVLVVVPCVAGAALLLLPSLLLLAGMVAGARKAEPAFCLGASSRCHIRPPCGVCCCCC